MENNVSFLEEKKCTGCGLCSHICNRDAIKIVADPSKHHFIFPIIDKNKCTNCGLCLKKCPLNSHSIPSFTDNPTVILYKNDDHAQALESSSGGVFLVIAESVLKSNGIVYGASWSANLKVLHKRVTNANDLKPLLGSKYIQSYISKEIYKSIQEDISNGKRILFSGTPCQVAAVRNLFGKDIPKNLLLVEVICHGVPNQYGFDKQIEEEEQRIKGKIATFKFRYKKRIESNNRAFCYSYCKSGKEYQVSGSYEYLPYYSEFQNGKIYRKSCYACKFRNNHRFSDLTIGDFWGITKIDSSVKTEFGKSIIFINTEKGRELTSVLENKKEYDFDVCKNLNGAYLFDANVNSDYSIYESADKNHFMRFKTSHILVSTKILIKNALKFVSNFLTKTKYSYILLVKKKKL